MPHVTCQEVWSVFELPSDLCPWRPFRALEEGCMVDVNVYYFFWMSMCIYNLYTIPGGVPLLGKVSGILGISRVALESLSKDAARVLPRTAARTKEVIDRINEIIPSNASDVENRLLTSWEAERLKNAVQALQSTLEEESRHSYIVGIEDQRGMSAYSLVEKVENFFRPEAWQVIEKNAKKEFEESARCIAFERFTGAGFHSLRGVECVIRQCILKLTGSLPKKRDWGHYAEVLRGSNADPKAIAVIDNIRTLERNPLMHPEDWLDVDEAIGIFNISQTAVSRLSTLL